MAVQARRRGATWLDTGQQLRRAGYYKHEGEPTAGFVRRLVMDYPALKATYDTGRGDPGEGDSGAAGEGEEREPVVPMPTTALRFDEYVFEGLDTESVKLPRFTGEPHIYGDCIVAGDFQLPTTDFEFAEKILVVARALNIKTLLIVGDWVNMDAFSKYDHIVPPIPFTTEVSVSVQLMQRYAEWFDTIWLALGNHEHRLVRLMKGDISGSMLGRLLSAGRGKLRVTPYSHIIIHSGDQVWRATHQSNYSKLKGRVGDELAQKFQVNVLVHHQHHASKMMDRYGRYVIIDNGGLFDVDKMSYVKLRDSTSVGMTKGFTVLLNGTGHLITPYPAFTDLDLWLKQVTTKGSTDVPAGV
jgi:hypothetical protein